MPPHYLFRASLTLERVADPLPDMEARAHPSPPPASSSAPFAAVDSGIDAGSSSEFDQENSGNHALEAHDDTSEASTDEG